MKKIVLLLLTCLALSVSAQEKKAPDYEQIEQNTGNPSSPYFYTHLMDKYLSGDANMTLEEKRHLYYGFIFQNMYNPYKSSKYDDLIKSTLRKSNLKEKDYQQVVYWSDFALKDNPFNTNVLQWRTFALFKIGMSGSETYDKALAQAGIIRDAILSSGDGKTLESSFHVILIQHEYDLLSYLDLNSTGQELEERNNRAYDRIILEKNVDNMSEIYFDISPTYTFGTKKPKSK